MNILITGGAGFIGSSIAKAYLDLGHNITLIDDLWSGRKKNIPENCNFYKIDIRDPEIENICNKHEIEFINHHAARGDVRQSLVIPEDYADVNVVGGIKLLEIARKRKMKGFVFSSTGGCVYGEPLYIPIDEVHPLQPIDPYGASKACFETYMHTYKKLYDLNFIIFRYANIYGPRQNPFGEAGVVSIFTSTMLEDKDITINGNGDQQRDYLYIDDVVNANVMALDKLDNEIYNLGTSIGTDVNQIFNYLKEITNFKKDPIYSTAKDGEVMKNIISSKKIFENWGWKAQTNLNIGLFNTVEYIAKEDI